MCTCAVMWKKGPTGPTETFWRTKEDFFPSSSGRQADRHIRPTVVKIDLGLVLINASERKSRRECRSPRVESFVSHKATKVRNQPYEHSVMM